MATLSIRNLSEEDHKASRLRAAHHGVSMEAEAREIPRQALRNDTQTAGKRRMPPESIADNGKTLGDPTGPLVDVSDRQELECPA